MLARTFLLVAIFPLACRSSAGNDAAKESAPVAPATSTAMDTSGAAAPSPPAKPAALGELAPDFTLPDLDGKPVRLSEFRGKTVVLEWFNPDCPFVRASHTKGSLVDTAARATKDGAIWLAINSGAPGKQGHGVATNRAGKERFSLTHPILLDESGSVGRLYGAARTPHMYVVSAEGKLVYRGAIDNSPDGEADSPAGGTLVRYVENALVALKDGKSPSVAETEAYGCSVKYLN
jgi:peroxiredoxin